jgi:hypothetical protein
MEILTSFVKGMKSLIKEFLEFYNKYLKLCLEITTIPEYLLYPQAIE